jgi:type IV pilus assembly protein PilV
MQSLNSLHLTRRQRGFSLIEVLIAILVLAIGLLGMANMQASGMRSTHGAYLRTQATILADDILDSMRANVTAARAGNYDILFTGAGTAGTIAGDDLVLWKANLLAMLPAGNGQITTAGSDVTVEIAWTGLRQDETANQAVVVTGQNKLFTVDTTL